MPSSHRTAPVTVRAFAKINVDLRVLGVLPDGYHEVRTILQSVALHDTLTFTRSRGPVVIACDTPGVPRDSRNLVWKALALVHARVRGRRGEPRGVHVTLKKRIPAEAGLGGGSADAAATLLAATRLWRLDLDLASLARLAALLGSDVPFFLAGGTALGTGRGDDVSPLPEPPPTPIVIVKPRFGVATAEAYRWVDEDRRPRPRRPTRVLPGTWPPWAAGVGNDLEAPVARRHPVIRRLTRALVHQGALHAAMSGSGSAVFGVFDDVAAARAAEEALARFGWDVIRTRTLSRAAVARERRRVLAGD
jgi:4-diphosphocytidyl-2-C-methyl-D-erythritol kinase